MISFIIPAYNAQQLIGRCLKSVVSQNTPLDYEVLVVDDGSTDNTGSIVCDLAEQYPQIRYLKKPNGGVSSARNYGLQNCSGAYIAFLDADDYLEENALAQLEGYEQFDLTVFGYYYTLSRGAFPVTLPNCADRYDVQSAFAEIYRANMFNSVWNKIYRRELITVPFDEGYVMGEDLLFNIHYYRNIRTARVVNKPLYYYFVNENSATQKYNPGFITNFIKTYESLADLTRELGADTDSDIRISLLDNIAGTVRLLVFNKDYRYCRGELDRIRSAIKGIEIKVKSRSLIHNVTYALLRNRCDTLIFIMMKLMKQVKKLRG